jgi:uncharacterized membrane protein
MVATPAEPSRSPSIFRRAVPWLVTIVAVSVLSVWLWKTPPGILGKADAIGYAICHRIDDRSFHLDGRAMPLCARCTGTFLGAVLGLVVMAGMKRAHRGGLSPVPVLATLVLFIGLMGIDGVNSYASLFPGLPHLYQPQNWLRLVTGMFEGIALIALIYPIFNQTLWKHWEDRPALANFKELGLIAGVAVVLIGLVLSDNPWVLFPLALLSAAGVLLMLTLLDTIILLIVTRQENRAEGWNGAVLPLFSGATLALIQVAAIDAARYAIFQSWGGLVFPK